MTGIWAEGKRELKNSSIAFFKYFNSSISGTLSISGGSCYQIFCDGKMVGFGPNRAAHNFSRIQNISINNVKNLVILMAGYNIKTFWLLNEQPFFNCQLTFNDKTVLSHNDFTCCELTDKKIKVQRYSYQRAFLESYKIDSSRRGLLLDGKCNYPLLKTEEFNINTLIPSHTNNPKLNYFSGFDVIESGYVGVDSSANVWRDRAHVIMGKECYPLDEWEDFATDQVSRFTYSSIKVVDANLSSKTDSNVNKKTCGKYKIYDFKRAITGFLNIKLTVKSSSTVYAIYDELIWEEENNIIYSDISGANKLNSLKNISFYRNTCSNVFKWELTAGEHDLVTLEPYAMRYVKIVILGDAEVKSIGITDYENPDCSQFEFSVSDLDATAILKAAVDTFAQNAVDLLTDCPSRERAGWLSDSYFSSVAEHLFTGKNLVEESFLENYTLFTENTIPKGMVPMCYPADNQDGCFIPNWAMWYILEVYKNFKVSGNRKVVDAAEKNIFGIYDYFTTLTNSSGMLEDLKNWVFVEWSEANNPDHIAGVNIPSNMCYSACLAAMGEMFDRRDLTVKSQNLKKEILERAFDGEFFVDNLLRKDGELVKSGLKTEVCQYYAFWFNIASKDKYSKLYYELMNNLGVNRKAGYRPDVGKPNAMYGIYMRLDLLEREGKILELYSECKAYFTKMAVRTGTLWEHNDINASTIHGFASYAAKWLIYSLTGYLNGRFYSNFIGIDCTFTIPKKDGKIKITISSGTRHIENV